MQETMPGVGTRGRPRTVWIDNIKTWTGLSVEETIRMTKDSDKWRKYVQPSDRGRLRNRTFRRLDVYHTSTNDGVALVRI